MKRTGALTNSGRQLRLVVVIHVLWMSVVFALGAWWIIYATRLVERIAHLEAELDYPLEAVEAHFARAQRMLFWESGTFYFLLIISTAVLLWIYFRDYLRAKSLHAFFASVTHELRTPLASIRLQAESIAESLGKDPAQKDLLNRLLEDTMRLEGQVERTLELARIEGGGPLFTQSIQIRPWLERTLRVWKETYLDRLDVDLECDDISFEADPSAIDVILKNLLENSMRHSLRDKVRIVIRTIVEDGHVILVFRDNGVGYAGDSRKLGRLFAKGTTSKGTGVGLYLVKSLMKRMGGTTEFSGAAGFEAKLKFRRGATDG